MNQKKGSIMKYMTFCGGINEDVARKPKKKSLNAFVD